jgi:hypothetical protein
MESGASMPEFSAAGERAIDDVARRHGFSPDAVAGMLRAVRAGHGRMAQFRHAEFGGSGQWMRGGMTMVGDMFDTALKARVERLCDELSQLVGSEPDLGELFGADPASAQSAWWPAELGHPNSAGAQNNMRYAYFAAPRRLAIDVGGRVTIYDTLDHRISGVAQQQSGHGTLAFTSQLGVVVVASLPEIADAGGRATADARGQAAPVAGRSEAARTSNMPDIVSAIEKLAELRSKGILTEAEFEVKKTELLGRL